MPAGPLADGRQDPQPGPSPGGGRQTITACVIAHNEQERLPRCLGSLDFCDELVVVDSGSTDQTVALAEAAGARVVRHPWQGFSVQRNVAIDNAHGEWLLEIDADEWVTRSLAAEIQQFLSDPPAGVSMAMLPMRQQYLGGSLGPSGHYPFYRPRMFRNGAYRHDESRTVHEGLSPLTQPWLFTSDLRHDLASDLSEAIADAWAYARLEAKRISAPPVQVCLKGMLARPVAKFAYQTVLLGAWRDGWRGVLKVGVECLADALVWLLVVLRPGRRGGPSRVPTGHFGSPVQRGPLRLVAVAAGAGSIEHTRGWLAEARAAGAWIVLVTDAAGASVPGCVHRVERITPILLMRALDAEVQAAPFDAVVALDRRSLLVARCLPSGLRTDGPVITPTGSATDLVRSLRPNET